MGALFPKSVEISEGVVVDYDAKGNIVGIDIDNASKKLSINKQVINKLPSDQEVFVKLIVQ